MTIADLLELFVDDSQMIRIFDIGDADCPILYEGEGKELLDDWKDLEISSLDNIWPNSDCYIGINIDLNSF